MPFLFQPPLKVLRVGLYFIKSMIKATWMSNNILTIESLLADSVPTSNYEWADEFPNLSLKIPNTNFEGDRTSLLKECSIWGYPRIWRK